jgi:hypothetical protein
MLVSITTLLIYLIINNAIWSEVKLGGFDADSSFVPPLIYSILGSSRHLGVGPVSIASLVMGSMLSEAVSPNEEPDLYLKLAFTATLFAGLFQASLGLLRYYIFAHPQLFSSFIIIYIYIFLCQDDSNLVK